MPIFDQVSALSKPIYELGSIYQREHFADQHEPLLNALRTVSYLALTATAA